MVMVIAMVIRDGNVDSDGNGDGGVLQFIPCETDPASLRNNDSTSVVFLTKLDAWPAFAPTFTVDT